MTTIVKTHEPADFLAMTPTLLGMNPSRSLVIIGFRDRRTCGAMRFDLPRTSKQIVEKRLITFALGMISKLPNVTGVLPIIVCDDLWGPTTIPPFSEFAHAVARRFHDAGFRVWDLICQAGDGYASYLDSDTPAGGHPLENIARSPARSRMAEASPDRVREPRPFRVPDAPIAERNRVAEQFAQFGDLIENLRSHDETPAALREFEDVPDLMERALRWNDAEIATKAALILFIVQPPKIRDAVMLQWATDRETGYRLESVQRAFSGRSPGALRAFDGSLCDLLFGIGPQPDPDRIEAAIALLLAVVERASDELRPAPLCMLGWLHWALGRGTDAGRFIDEARSIDPDDSMAELLYTMFANGMFPEWAFAARAD
jgi:hypothetical protein